MTTEYNKYNGWTNYETWLFVERVKNVYRLTFACEDFYKQHHKDDNAEYEFKLFLEREFYVARFNMYYVGESFSTREWALINFKEVLECFKPEGLQ